jgi:hypothetical protein
MKRPVFFVVLCLLLQVCVRADVSLESLLTEMLDRSRIARFPHSAYTCAQASSYDRASNEVNGKDWFANLDFAQYLRAEEKDGRREWVMMEQQGPGAVVRFWITSPAYRGNLRIYIDGSSEPVIFAPVLDVIGGSYLVGSPLSAERSRGRNLYLPIPYAKSIKVTYDGGNPHETGDGQDNLYYNINYATYDSDVAVRSFTLDDLKANEPLISRVQAQLLLPEANKLPISRTVPGASVTLKPGQAHTVDVTGSGAIAGLHLRLKNQKAAQATRSVVISMSFDGNQTVWSPVGQFFGTGTGIHPFKGWWRQVQADGRMSCYWPMPFAQSASVTLTNFGASETTIELADIEIAEWQWDARSMYFHASWRGDDEIEVQGARGTRDWNYLTIDGKGVYAGETLSVFNPVSAWWGEGDEKIYIDGEDFPSHFGTGTEDYFGYAWCDSAYFTAPFHAQPQGDGNNSPDHTTNTRIRILDKIPFERSFKFDMELWHWQKTAIDYAVTTYWYGFPESRSNGERSPEKAKRPVRYPLIRVEGERLQHRRVTGGYTEIQENPNWGWSEGKQLWWKFPEIGDRLEMGAVIPKQGTYQVKLKMTTAHDYGRFNITLDGQSVGEHNFYAPEGVQTVTLDLGQLEIQKGEHRLAFEVLRPDAGAVKGNMLGIDYIEWIPME